MTSATSIAVPDLFIGTLGAINFVLFGIPPFAWISVPIIPGLTPLTYHEGHP